jgi:exopolysaccharide production protein ExoY
MAYAVQDTNKMAYAVQDVSKMDAAPCLLYDFGSASTPGVSELYPVQSYARSRPLGGALKRSLDIIVALMALMFFAPLMLALAFLVWIQRDGPVFYRQTRVGFGGRSFACLKFRSMVANSNERLEQFLEINPFAKAEWLATHKLRHDPRITPFGKFLRKSSLDELPQLLNIVCGDMSIVGPRPIVSAEVNHYEDSISSYMRSRPGLTGLWQISGRSETSYRERVELDVKYVEEWNIFEDVAIMLKTIPAVLSSKGSY